MDLCKAYFGIEAEDELLRSTAKVHARLEQLDPALMADAPAFLALLELPVVDPAWTMLGARQQRRRTLDAHYEKALRLATEKEVKRDVANRMHRRRFASRDGARLAFYEHGSAGQTLLLVMATAYRMAFFQPGRDAVPGIQGG